MTRFWQGSCFIILIVVDFDVVSTIFCRNKFIKSEEIIYE
ncbi:hypothetical protein EPL77_12775 [Clostridioides difficile]|nr:hypothetical protein [Clostridioides difficile]ERM52330.1 hypothetical protein QUQ_0125 [Clostridioides difficile P68]EGT3907243.1 hypothetical protein [Clostridioides difficile]EGT4083470.1 hypothetical protein [Clostridioides difficile]EGT4166950.1 hypothetical protein [Clostridioides difficile]